MQIFYHTNLLTGDLRRSPPRSPPLRRSTGDREEPDDDDELDDEDEDEEELEKIKTNPTIKNSYLPGA